MFDSALAPDPIEQLLAALPGADSMRALVEIDVSALDPFDRIDLLKAWERNIAWAQAQQQPVIAAVAGQQTMDDYGREDVARALRLSGSTAGSRVEVARALCGPLHRTNDALAAGNTTYLQAWRLVAETRLLDDDTARKVEERVLPKAPRQTVGEFSRAVRKAVIAIDPTGSDNRAKAAYESRDVTCTALPDSMAFIGSTVTAVDAAEIMRMLDEAARAAGVDDVRTMAQRRADAFVDVFRGTPLSATAGTPTVRARTRELGLLIDLPTLLKLADHPSELSGYGAIPPGIARMFAEGGVLRRLVTDPLTGQLLDRAPDTYAIPDDLAAFAITRDQTCCVPGCGKPAYGCDVDHEIPFSRGGRTVRRNLGPLCRRHHRMKTHGGWRLERWPDDRLWWVSPTGHAYECERPGFTEPVPPEPPEPEPPPDP